MTKEYKSVTDVSGPLMIISKVKDISYGELVKVITPNGEEKLGQVLELDGDKAVIQLFKGTDGIDTKNTHVRFVGETMKFGVSESMLGRVFNAIGKPIDGGPAIIAEKRIDINGQAINPSRRDHPEDFIQTGVSSIDLMNTLVRGQKLPIFSGAGLPHNKLASQIARQATTVNDKSQFAVVFAAMGITHEEAVFFRKELQDSGNFENSIMFLNLAKDPAIERIIMPRIALTVAEYLAYERGMNILVILTDLTNYCEALREIAASRYEVPGRRGYPGYMYTDLASIYERAGKIKGRKGSITQIPILTMPDDDITHPIPDLTGYITEGQFVLNRDLSRKGIFPPVNVLPSLSRLMNKGIGEGKTTKDHKSVSDQMYAAYARGIENRDLVMVVGEESLDEMDRMYLKFADNFENRIVTQGYNEDRDIQTTINISWELLSTLPKSELKRIPPEFVDEFYGKIKTENIQDSEEEVQIDVKIDTDLSKIKDIDNKE